MGMISAEARGMVRAQLARLNEPIHDSVLARLHDIAERRTQCFGAGKRLKEVELAELNTEFVHAVPVGVPVDGAILYAHHAVGTMEEGRNTYQEGTVIVRSLRLENTRRKVAFTDHMLGATFCLHSLCRIVERLTLAEPLVEYTLRHTPSLAAHLLVLWQVCRDNLNFAVPFGDGVALGTFVTMKFDMASTSFVANESGMGFSAATGTTPWNDLSNNRHAGRISTFLSADQLTSAQEDLVGRWNRIRNKYEPSWEWLVARMVRCDSWSASEFDERSRQIREAVQALVDSEPWRRVVRPSRIESLPPDSEPEPEPMDHH
jgi:hypothetical protein